MLSVSRKVSPEGREHDRKFFFNSGHRQLQTESEEVRKNKGFQKVKQLCHEERLKVCSESTGSHWRLS